ncbi:AAA family ATPase [Anaeropeptidivorans aminofermentans]|uniref:AAA family ATPase n=1 Tax=Anaeropeptidivorans aminofermentans TaxID=2934315 RepID=UPI00202403F0|nr:MoxR family ATPase [Anaeropeptidivorans aminofermentans]
MNVETGFTAALVNKVKDEIKKAVINQEEITEYALTCMLAGGHVLIEGVPGLGKTLWVRSLSKALNIDFNRVQFTSDLMPADILGTKLYNMEKREFELKKGPLFTNLFLADEINRTPPKTQSALLEVMEERSITIDGDTFHLNDPFMVFATQNPVEYEGTYPLPEALTDRFMMKLIMKYPGVSAEKKLLSMYNTGFSSAKIETAEIVPAANAEDFKKCREEILNVRVEDSILNYIVSIIETTRRVNAVSIGASPRGSVALLLNAKALAAIRGRDFCVPDDVKELAIPVLRHRIILKPEAEIDGLKTDKVIENILSQVKVPR